MDDQFPCYAGNDEKDHGGIAFNSTGANEIWAMLLEKAWAKVNGSYNATISGHAYRAMYAITGAPCTKFKNRYYKYDDMWDVIFNSDLCNFPMTCSSITFDRK